MRALKALFRPDTASGVLLFFSAVLAMLVANSPASGLYEALLGTPVELRIGTFEIAKPLLLWINDGLMAVFFLFVGLELKRELVSGALSSSSRAILPLFGAMGGLAAPALVYTAFNSGDPVAMKGWAIPAATDIAFSLGVLSVLGARVPIALKVFLVSLATIDDVGAILIIALFYTSELGTTALLLAGLTSMALLVLNRMGVARKAPYLLLGLVLWILVLKSGVHATLAGVLLAFFIPLNSKRQETSPLIELEHDLYGAVSYGILPVFAFANAGVSLAGLTIGDALTGVPLGIALGLIIGKPLGVMSMCWLAVRSGLAQLPTGVTWRMLAGVSMLCGIGFTMSLFIGSLAFEQGGSSLVDDRIGILLGSFVSGIAGFLLLRRVTRAPAEAEAPAAIPGSGKSAPAATVA